MGYRVNDRIEVFIYFDEVEYLLDKLNTLNFLHIGTSVKTNLPTLHFSINDQSCMVINQNLLKDGTVIKVAIKARDGETKSYTFRLFKFNKVYSPGIDIYEIDGFLDSPRFWFTTSNLGIQGTSNSALKQVAEQCGLKYDGLTTNDQQLWHPNNKTFAQFCRYITNAGWISDTSCMIRGVTEDGIMRYKDVNNIQQSKFTLIQGSDQPGALNVVDFSVQNDSGFTNKRTGYWADQRGQQGLGKETLTSHNKIEFKPDVQSPMYNDQLKTKTERGAQFYSPIDFGNSHESYSKAVYQNIRYKNLYSFAVDFLLDSPTSMTLLDKFTFSANQQIEVADIPISGNYVVTSKAIFIKGTTYAEKIEGHRHGVNFKG